MAKKKKVEPDPEGLDAQGPILVRRVARDRNPAKQEGIADMFRFDTIDNALKFIEARGDRVEFSYLLRPAKAKS